MVATKKTGPSIFMAVPTTDYDDPEHRPGSQHWRDTSAALYTRLRGRLTDSRRELARVYPKTWLNYSPRPVAFVPWLSRQVATVYSNEPGITYVNPTTGAPLDVKAVEAITRIRAEAKVTVALLAAHEEAAGPGNGVVWVEPVLRKSADGGEVLSVECNVIPAHLQSVELRDRPRSTDERDVTAWRVKMPLPGGTDVGGSRDGTALVTPTSATWEEAEGDLTGQPIWPSEGGGGPSNPLGQVPAVVIRWTEPQPGVFWGDAREDLLWQARALDAGSTDIGEGVRHQMFGQWVGKRLGTGAGNIKMGFGTVIELTESDAELKCEGHNADIAGGRDALEAYTRMATASQEGNPAVLLRSTALTAEGKKIEIADREGLRKRHLMQLARAEQRIYDLMRAWLHALRGVEVLPPATLVVAYAPPELPENELQAEQAMELRIKNAQSSEIRERMKRDRCSYDEAKKRCVQDIEDQAELRKMRIAKGLVDVPTTPEAKPDSKGGDTKPAEAAKVTKPVEDVQKTALNGAQVTSLLEVVQAVASGALPPSAGREMILASFDIDPAAVDRMIGALKGFEPAPDPKTPGPAVEP